VTFNPILNFGNNAFDAAGFGFKPGAIVTQKRALPKERPESDIPKIPAVSCVVAC
jgi:hypothetical protein